MKWLSSPLTTLILIGLMNLKLNGTLNSTATQVMQSVKAVSNSEKPQETPVKSEPDTHQLCSIAKAFGQRCI